MRVYVYSVVKNNKTKFSMRKAKGFSQVGYWETREYDGEKDVSYTPIPFMMQPKSKWLESNRPNMAK